MHSDTATLISTSDVQIERLVSTQELRGRMDQFRPIIYANIIDNEKQARDYNFKGCLPKFSEGDYVLVLRDDFFESQEICWRCRGPPRITKAHNDYDLTSRTCALVT